MPPVEEGPCLVIRGSGFGKVAQYIDVDMLSTALGQDGVDRTFGFDHAGRLSGADPEDARRIRGVKWLNAMLVF
jgi:hypothetical protein